MSLIDNTRKQSNRTIPHTCSVFNGNKTQDQSVSLTPPIRTINFPVPKQEEPVVKLTTGLNKAIWQRSEAFAQRYFASSLPSLPPSSTSSPSSILSLSSPSSSSLSSPSSVTQPSFSTISTVYRVLRDQQPYIFEDIRIQLQQAPSVIIQVSFGFESSMLESRPLYWYQITKIIAAAFESIFTMDLDQNIVFARLKLDANPSTVYKDVVLQQYAYQVVDTNENNSTDRQHRMDFMMWPVDIDHNPSIPPQSSLNFINFSTQGNTSRRTSIYENLSLYENALFVLISDIYQQFRREENVYFSKTDPRLNIDVKIIPLSELEEQ